MSWITVAWSMNTAACLTLAAFYGASWCKQRDNWVHLLFSFGALAAAATSLFELSMLNAAAVEQYQLVVRRIHVPTWVLALSFVVSVRLDLKAGQAWIAWSIYSLRPLLLIVYFIFSVGITFRAIAGIRLFPCEVHPGPWPGTTVPCSVPLPAQPSVSSI